MLFLSTKRKPVKSTVSVGLWVVCSLNVARLLSSFLSVYSESVSTQSV